MLLPTQIRIYLGPKVTAFITDFLSLTTSISSLRPDVSFNAVGGPCTSYELADKIHTEVAFCGKDNDILNELRDSLRTEYYHISVTDDIVGIETAVALKNACAMAVSLAIGVYTENDPSRPEKYNAQSGLFYEAAREMRSIINVY